MLEYAVICVLLTVSGLMTGVYIGIALQKEINESEDRELESNED